MARNWNDSNSVPVDPFRERYLQLLGNGSSSMSEVCRRLDWTLVKRVPDSSRLRRTLGLARDAHDGYRQRITLETAEMLCEALDMDPYEAGL